MEVLFVMLFNFWSYIELDLTNGNNTALNDIEI